MSENALITFVPGSLPEGVCPQNTQELFNLFTQFLSGYLPGTYSTFNFGSTEPTVDNQDKPWIRTNADGSIDGVYTFSAGSWIRPHPLPAGPNSMRYIWVGSLASLALFEGGDAGVISDRTGSFYEQDVDFNDVIPRGATATVPVSTNASELGSGASATDQVRGVYFVKRSSRTFFVA